MEIQQQQQREEEDDDIPPKEWKRVIGENALFVDDDTDAINNKIIETIQQMLDHPRISLFIDWIDDSDFGYDTTMLVCAIENGRLDIVKLLLEHGADVNIPDRWGGTALMKACDYGRNISRKGNKIIEIVKLLLKKGADVTIADKKGNTALLYASGRGHVEVVKLLLDKGANVTIANHGGSTALMWASYGGHTKIVQLLLDRGADITMASKTRGDTALMEASKNGHTATAKLLVEHGADINTVNNYGETALFLAYKGNHEKVMELLLSVMLDKLEIPLEWTRLLYRNHRVINNTDIQKVPIETIAQWMEHPKKEHFIDWKHNDISSGMTMLYSAVAQKRWDIAELLLEHGADANIATEHGWTALMWASYDEGGHSNMVQLLLDNGADCNIVNKDGDTALILAARAGHPEIVERLLGHRRQGRVDCTIVNKGGDTALDIACRAQRNDIVDLLLAAMLNDHDSDTPMEWTRLILSSIWTSEISNVDIGTFVTRWMDHPKKERFIDWKDDSIGLGRTMLHCAIWWERLDMVKLLLENGTNVNIVEMNGQTPLMYALEYTIDYTVEIVELIMAKGADITIADKSGDTALMKAAQGGQLDAVNSLVESGADIHAREFEYGWTPLHWACDSCHLEIIKSLLENGADCSATDNQGMTPLHRACEDGDLEVVQLLLSRGVNANTKTIQGSSSLHIACEENHVDIVWWLVRQYHEMVLEPFD